MYRCALFLIGISVVWLSPPAMGADAKAPAPEEALDTPVSLTLARATWPEALDAVGRAAGLSVVAGVPLGTEPVDLRFTRTPARAVLDSVARRLGAWWRKRENVVILSAPKGPDTAAKALRFSPPRLHSRRAMLQKVGDFLRLLNAEQLQALRAGDRLAGLELTDQQKLALLDIVHRGTQGTMTGSVIEKHWDDVDIGLEPWSFFAVYQPGTASRPPEALGHGMLSVHRYPQFEREAKEVEP